MVSDLKSVDETWRNYGKDIVVEKNINNNNTIHKLHSYYTSQ